MDMTTFIDLAEAWCNLGGAVQEQLKAVLDDSDTMEKQNPNALRVASDRFLREAAQCDDEQLSDDASSFRQMITDFLNGDRS